MNATYPPSSHSGPASTDRLSLHLLSDEELDLLPFGVIGLDRNGIIVRYNRAEARLARLDRALVLGQSFFEKVAPCTNNPEFRGRFEALAADPDGPRSVSFPFVFGFRFGTQDVMIEIVRTPSASLLFVCVNRKKLRGPSPSIPVAQLAIAQSELAPNEGRAGVLRDEVERRHVRVDGNFLGALRSAAARLGPDAARALLESWGQTWGRHTVLDLETEVAESFEGSLRELPMVTAMEVLAGRFKRDGWGSLVVDVAPAPRGLVGLRLERGALGEALAPSRAPACALLEAYFAALFSHLAGRPLVVREARCAAQGHPACTFWVTGASRLAALTQGIATSPDDPEAIAATLDAEAPRPEDRR